MSDTEKNRLEHFRELMRESSIGDEGIDELSARTSEGILAGILIRRAYETTVDALDPSPDLDLDGDIEETEADNTRENSRRK